MGPRLQDIYSYVHSKVGLTFALFLVTWRHWLEHSWLNWALLFWRQRDLQRSASLPCPVSCIEKDQCIDQTQAKYRTALKWRTNGAITLTFVLPMSVTNQKNAIEQYCHVVLFIMLYKAVLTSKSVDETLVWLFKWKPLRKTFMWYCLCP